ncbi:MAG TPA: M20/M25/M40 family metallo-hydrolase [Steroidobacteraceae bacterium]|nr:M20/M25/M40 family metallo-hydrolase [Steroidobacteraceae bacterium]
MLSYKHKLEYPWRACAALLLSLVPVAAAAAGAALTREERRIVAAAAAEDGRSIALLEKLVNINSGTMNFPGVERVGRVMMAELEPLGFDVQWRPMAAVGRAGLVLATHHARGHGKRVLLIGHLDTVFEPDSPFQRFERHGDSAEGPGVNDMKDGLAIMVGALRALHATGALDRADVTIVLAGDEEDAGTPESQARADLIAAAGQADVALEFEALATRNGHDMGTIARRSAISWTLRTTAQSGHSSGVFSAEAGYGANYELARIIDAFRRELREPNATYNIGLLSGGASAAINADGVSAVASGKTNVIAAQGIARGDLRTLSNAQTERMMARMRAIVADHLPGTNATLEFDEGYPAMAPTAGNRALLARLNEINAALGLEPMGELDPMERGAGDISFVADRLDCLVGFGAVGHGSHAPGETVELGSIDRQIKRTALLIERLSRTLR